MAALLVLRDGWSFDGLGLSHPPLSSSSGAPGGRPQPATWTSLRDLQAHCRLQGLAGFQLPRFVAAQRDPLPINGSGKVYKWAVRQRLEALRGNAAAVASSSSKL